MEMIQRLNALRTFYSAGNTRTYAYRKQALLQLKQGILRHEEEIYEALYTDLKKNREETWVTETGFLLAEINHTLRHLKNWMKPERAGTNLLNFPSRSRIYNEPLGVVLIIGPWNYPLQLLLTPLVGALAAGNCAVIKPSEFAPATAAVIQKLVAESFDPAHVFFVQGEGSVVIPQLMEQFRFDHLFYTGSTGVGKLIYQMASAQLVPVTLELGGKSPCVVERDANIKTAAKRIALTKFSNAGQMCVAPDYILVHESVKDQFTAALIERIRDFFSEDPAHDYHFGKIINRRQFERLRSYLEQGRIIYGGQHDEVTGFMAPTLVTDLPPGAAIMGEEIFGPLLPIISFKTFEEASSIISQNPDPLAFYVFTGSREKEKQWIEGIHFGGGCVNNASWHLTNFNLPFGGRGNSGMGAYHGKFSYHAFSHRKGIMKTPTWFDPSVKYPPFKGKLNLFKKIIR